MNNLQLLFISFRHQMLKVVLHHQIKL